MRLHEAIIERHLSLATVTIMHVSFMRFTFIGRYSHCRIIIIYGWGQCEIGISDHRKNCFNNPNGGKMARKHWMREFAWQMCDTELAQQLFIMNDRSQSLPFSFRCLFSFSVVFSSFYFHITHTTTRKKCHVKQPVIECNRIKLKHYFISWF